MGKKSEIIGEVTTLFGKPTIYGNKLYLIVYLEDGKHVRVNIPSSAYYKKGGRVKLLKMEPLICCRIVYKFRGYEQLMHNKKMGRNAILRMTHHT